jgi:hypothetical protein
MKLLWKIRPYLGVLPFVFRALRAGRAEGQKRASVSKQEMAMCA